MPGFGILAVDVAAAPFRLILSTRVLQILKGDPL